MLPAQALIISRFLKIAVYGVLWYGFTCLLLPAQARQTAAPPTPVDAARKVRPRRVFPLPAPMPAPRQEVTNHSRPRPAPINVVPRPGQPRGRNLWGFFRTTEISGFIDLYYSFNFNRPFNNFNVARSYDIRHNGLKLNLAEWVFEKKPEAGKNRFGFRFDVNFGTARDLIHAAEPGRNKVYRVFQQGYVSYLMPFGSGLQIDAGKFVTWIGAEVIESKDNWNYSRSLLFVSQPNYHLGVRGRYVFNNKVSLLGAVVNGWNNVEENNRGKSYGVALALTPTRKLSFTQSYLTGPEQPNDRRRKRRLFDTILSYNFNRRFSVLGNYDYGFDTRTDGRKARWQGVSVAARYVPARRVAVSSRLEWFADYDGFITGTPQRLRESTVTGDYQLTDDLLLRGEYRRDWSDQPFFNGRDPLVLQRQQNTVLGSVIYTFSRPLSPTTADPTAGPPPTPGATPQP